MHKMDAAKSVRAWLILRREIVYNSSLTGILCLLSFLALLTLSEYGKMKGTFLRRKGILAFSVLHSLTSEHVHTLSTCYEISIFWRTGLPSKR